MKKVLFVLSGVLFLSLGSCEKEENVKVTKNNERDLKVDNLNVARNNEHDLKEYFGQLRTTIKNDFAQLKKNHALYNDWVTAGEKMYEGNESALESFRKNVDQSQADFKLNSQLRSYSGGYQLNEINMIINESSKFHTFEEYKNYLDERFEYFLNDSTLSQENKKFILTFLVSYSESASFILEHNDFAGKFTKSHASYSPRGWLSHWWKCALSVIGGVVTGATTVGLAGVAVGTVAMPVIGTVSGGVLGAIGGGIGGGITAAATAC